MPLTGLRVNYFNGFEKTKRSVGHFFFFSSTEVKLEHCTPIAGNYGTTDTFYRLSPGLEGIRDKTLRASCCD
jgi:hypothetical protein